MAKIYSDISRTLDEFLLIPGLTKKEHNPTNISLKTPVVRFKKNSMPDISINIPLVSAAMQSVSGEKMAIELAKSGGLSFIFCSQSIESQSHMVKKVKENRAGFVSSSTNLKPSATIQDAITLTNETGHSTIAVTDDGTSRGKLLGLLTDKDYRVSKVDTNSKVTEFMTPFEDLAVGRGNIDLAQANDLLWENKVNCIPIIDSEQHLTHLVFRKDYHFAQDSKDAVVDKNKSFLVGAAVNTRDYEKRIPALVEAGADVLCIDSSDGYSEWQKSVISFVRENYGDKVKIGAGNVVSKEGFMYLAEAGADFIKVGIGGGSICITRETKGIGRGQASALIDVCSARDEFLSSTGIYIPVCSDGGIVNDYHITLSLALGADFVMMGRYFARFEESPTRLRKVGNNFVKEYWGEGSNRARNWERYDVGGKSNLYFEEGVDSYISYAGKLKENIDRTIYKIKSTFCNCGASSIAELQKDAVLTLVSELSIREGKAHDVELKDIE
ncbi:MAG: IMP dehydrogenase [Lachnospirales bacterium]